jgi:hypothetical protein
LDGAGMNADRCSSSWFVTPLKRIRLSVSARATLA